jgi:hypothetical protein
VFLLRSNCGTLEVPISANSVRPLPFSAPRYCIHIFKHFPYSWTLSDQSVQNLLHFISSNAWLLFSNYFAPSGGQHDESQLVCFVSPSQLFGILSIFLSFRPLRTAFGLCVTVGRNHACRTVDYLMITPRLRRLFSSSIIISFSSRHRVSSILLRTAGHAVYADSYSLQWITTSDITNIYIYIWGN